MDSRILHYEFVTGESVNITVSAEIAEVIYDSRRMEHASNERSRYHTAFSLDSEDYEGTNLVSEKTPDDLMEELEDREHLLDCLAHLSENQRQRILMLAQGMSITEIARVQHADRTTVRERSVHRNGWAAHHRGAYSPQRRQGSADSLQGVHGHDRGAGSPALCRAERLLCAADGRHQASCQGGGRRCHLQSLSCSHQPGGIEPQL